MENIYNNYKNIIERAIFSGIITEESRQFYLSAIEEENESELSELESRVNIEETTNSDLNFKQNKENFDMLKPTSSENNKNETAETEILNNEYSQLMLSESSIENYSILDIKSPKYKNDFNEESDSDMSSFKQESMHSALPRKLKSTKCVTKVIKKPLKHNQIMDFNVPIYMGIKKERSETTSHAGHCTKSTRQKTSSKNSSSRILGTGKAQSLNKWTIPKSRVPEIEIQGNTSLTNSNKFINSRSQLDQNYCETNTSEIQKSEKSQSRKCIYTCPQPQSRGEQGDSHKGNLEEISNNQEVTQGKTVCYCMSQKNPINSSLRLKVYRERLNKDPSHEIKLKQTAGSDVHQHSSNDVKNKEKSKMLVKKNSYKCKPCRCNCFCKSTTQPLTCVICNTETDNEEGHSVDNTPLAANSNEKKKRVLNFNIICQFYENEELKMQNDSQGHKNSNETHEPQEKPKNEVSEEPHTEVKKTKQNKKIRLPKIFNNFKISRK